MEDQAGEVAEKDEIHTGSTTHIEETEHIVHQDETWAHHMQKEWEGIHGLFIIVMI